MRSRFLQLKAAICRIPRPGILLLLIAILLTGVSSLASSQLVKADDSTWSQ